MGEMDVLRSPSWKSFHDVCVYHVITLLTLNTHKDACQLFLNKVEKRKSRGAAPASPSCRLLWGHALQNPSPTAGPEEPSF